ncbi:hypothetical protein LCGC14_2300920 [marine sediment metagenome]|uniref:Uncharacterized protein n=1 Tax=marine sediment metagenome TaxID=412755 RepID=A0A0F9FIG8_9ZZZZ
MTMTTTATKPAAPARAHNKLDGRIQWPGIKKLGVKLLKEVPADFDYRKHNSISRKYWVSKVAYFLFRSKYAEADVFRYNEWAEKITEQEAERERKRGEKHIDAAASVFKNDGNLNDLVLRLEKDGVDINSMFSAKAIKAAKASQMADVPGAKAKKKK